MYLARYLKHVCLFDQVGHKRFYQGESLAIFCLAIPIFKDFRGIQGCKGRAGLSS